MAPPVDMAPQSLKEALSLLSEYGPKARVSAGGTDFLLSKGKRALPEVMIRLGGIRGCDYIEYEPASGLRLGALTRLRRIRDSHAIRIRFPVLFECAGLFATPTIRNQATIGGNLCNGSPAADTAPVLMVLGAKVKLQSRREERVLAVEDFFLGPGATALRGDELLTEIQIPDVAPGSGAVYLKQKRSKGGDLTIVGVAAMVEMRGDIVEDARIALGAVGPTPIRARDAEALLIRKRLDDSLLEQAGQLASSQSRPIDDLRASSDYRRRLVAVLVKRALWEAAQRSDRRIRECPPNKRSC